jgi:hypothetical protein
MKDMKVTNKRFRLLAVLMFILLPLLSCKHGKTGDSGAGLDTISERIDFSKSRVFNDINYRFPPPNDILEYMKNAGMKYNSGLVNKSDNYDKYLDICSQASNLGVYSADLGYLILFKKRTEAIDYFSVIHKLSDQLRISSAYDDEIIKRIKDNINNIDSLSVIAQDAYNYLLENLEVNNKQKVLAVISTGGFVESLYLALNLNDKFSAENRVIQRIADQKYALENLVGYMDHYKKDPLIVASYSNLLQLKQVYDGLQQIEEKTIVKTDKSGKVIFSGGTRLQINEKQFLELKKTVLEIRSKMVKENER